jgi:hypothetical protein
MPQYIDIDVAMRTVNGELVSVDEALQTLQNVRSEPGRFQCLYRNDYGGRFRYADFQSGSAGAGADHDRQ